MMCYEVVRYIGPHQKMPFYTLGKPHPMTTDMGTTEFRTQNKNKIIEFIYILTSQLIMSFIAVQVI